MEEEFDAMEAMALAKGLAIPSKRGHRSRSSIAWHARGMDHASSPKREHGIANVHIAPTDAVGRHNGRVVRRERLGGFLCFQYFLHVA
jgi:hypothetical protein